MKKRNLFLLLVGLMIYQLGHSQINGWSRNTTRYERSVNSNRRTSTSYQTNNNHSYSRNNQRSIDTSSGFRRGYQTTQRNNNANSSRASNSTFTNTPRSYTSRNNESQARNHTISQSRNNSSIRTVKNNKEYNNNSRKLNSTVNSTQNTATTYGKHQFSNNVRNNQSTDYRYQGMNDPRYNTQSDASKIYESYRRMPSGRSQYHITNYLGMESSLDSQPTATFVTGYNEMGSNSKERFKAKMIDLAQSDKYGLPTLSENDLIVLYSLTKKERKKKMKEWVSTRIVQTEVSGYGNTIDSAYKDAFIRAVTEVCGLEVDTQSVQTKEDIQIFAESRILKYTTMVEDESQGRSFVKINATVYNGPAGVDSNSKDEEK